MSKSRINCPHTGQYCEGRQVLMDLQVQLGVEATNCAPNVITDDDSRSLRVIKSLFNMASSTTTALTARGLEQFQGVIDDALDAEPAIECHGSLCGTMGSLILEYCGTFLPDSYTIPFGKQR